jgi:hypothetical protein
LRANLSLNSIVGSPPAWLRHRESEMREALAKAGVRMVDIQRRAKHVAGSTARWSNYRREYSEPDRTMHRPSPRQTGYSIPGSEREAGST